MDTQKLHDLIDKVVGKKGPLRTPAYWMRRVLREVVGYVTELKVWAEDAMLKLESRINALMANFIKSIPEYTYAELKELKDKGLLIPGQKYKLTDYIPIFTYDTWYISQYSATPFKILLTAISPTEFSQEALLFRGKEQAQVLYYFDRTNTLSWCPCANEFLEIEFIKEGFGPVEMSLVSSGTTVSVEDYDPSAYLYYTCYDKRPESTPGSSLGVYRVARSANQAIVTNWKFEQLSNPKEIISVPIGDITSYYDAFRGIIYRYQNGYIDVPFDPHFTVKFDIQLPDGTEKVTYNGFKDVLPVSKFKITVKPLINALNGLFSLPRLLILKPYKEDESIDIGENCTNIYIEGAGALSVGSNCHDLWLQRSETPIEIPDNSHHVRLKSIHPGITLTFIGPAQYAYISELYVYNRVRSYIFDNACSISYDGVNVSLSKDINQITFSKFKNNDTNLKYVHLIYILEPMSPSDYWEKNLIVSCDADGVIKVRSADIPGVLTDSGDGTKYLSDDGIYKPLTSAAVVDEATGDSLDLILPFKLFIDPTTPISAEHFTMLRRVMIANRPIYVIIEDITYMALVTPDSDNSRSRLIVTILGLTNNSTLMGATVSLSPDEVPEVIIDAPFYMVKAGQGLNIEHDGTINCTLDTNPFITNITLPSEGVEGKIYLIPSTVTGEQNVMVEYIWVNGAWEKLGEFKTDVDLSAYALKTEVPGVADNLTEGGATKALSAEQGKVLKGEVSQLSQELQALKARVATLENSVTYIYDLNTTYNKDHDLDADDPLHEYVGDIENYFELIEATEAGKIIRLNGKEILLTSVNSHYGTCCYLSLQLESPPYLDLRVVKTYFAQGVWNDSLGVIVGELYCVLEIGIVQTLEYFNNVDEQLSKIE